MARSIYKKPWYVYIARCCDKTLYVGIALNVEKRIHAHNTTKQCRYTRMRKPIILEYFERCKNHAFAWRREKELKRFTRRKKLALICGAVEIRSKKS